MTDPLNHRALRDALEAQLRALSWYTRSQMRLDHDGDFRVVAGIVRKALAPQLHAHAETLAALERVREVLRQHRGRPAVPLRQLEAALHGDEDYLHA